MMVMWMVHDYRVWTRGVAVSLWVTAEEQLNRIPRGAFIDDREKQRKGEGDDNMLAQGPQQRETL